MRLPLPLIIFVGPPGCGKGTQAKLLDPYFQQISTGELLRSSLKDKTLYGAELEGVLGRGEFVSDELVFNILKDRLSALSCEKGIILDGFPRTVAQAEMLENFYKTSEIKQKKVILFSIPFTILIQRIEGRFSCSTCQAPYNDYLNLPKKKGICDHCGGTTFMRRQDDSRAVLEKRLKGYDEETSLLENYYSDMICKVNASLPVHELHEKICEKLGVEPLL